MTPPGNDPFDPSAEPPLGERLDSWKEIAAFLHRDVRTVQRWERQAGLPVHRHAAARLRTAYAYRSELEAWWRAQQTALESPPPPEATPELIQKSGLTARLNTRTRAVIVIAAVVAISAIVARVRPFPFKPRTATVAGTPRIPVVLAKIEDQAGDPELASLVDEAIVRQVMSQADLDPAPPARVGRALRLMRRDPATPLTTTIAREVCLRDGALAFAIEGRVHQLESQYFIDLQAVEPDNGRVAVSVERQTTNRRTVVVEAARAAAQLSADLARAPRPSMETLEAVTTTSLPALRLYTAAVHAGARREWGAAELLARRAIEADAQFASAYAWTGWAMRRQGRPRRECLPWLDRAVALSSGTTDRENYFITGTREAVARNLGAAIAAFEALLRLQPTDRQALDLLITTYARAGRFNEAVDWSVARAGYEPDDFYANVRAAHALLVWKGDAASAAPYIRRAQQLASDQATRERPVWAAWISGVPLFTAWMAGDRRSVLEGLAHLERTLDLRLGRERDAFATTVGFGYLALGKVKQAERALRRAGSPSRQIDLALVALALGQQRRARDWLGQVRQNSAVRPALFASVGLITEAESGLDLLPPSEQDEGITDVAQGLIALWRRDEDTALAALRRGIDRLQFSGEPEYFLAVEALARVLQAQGDPERALAWLSDATGQRARTYASTQWTGGCWIKLNADLASTYHRHGRYEEAERIRGALRTLLQDADAEYPLAGVLRPISAR